MRSTSTFAGKVIGPICPFVFSLTGLLLDGAVLVGEGSRLSLAWRFALVAGAPALAAIAAIKVAGDDLGDLESEDHFGRR
jgi:hypothetical protein